jgi:hypothetical protein
VKKPGAKIEELISWYRQNKTKAVLQETKKSFSDFISLTLVSLLPEKFRLNWIRP